MTYATLILAQHLCNFLRLELHILLRKFEYWRVLQTVVPIFEPRLGPAIADSYACCWTSCGLHVERVRIFARQLLTNKELSSVWLHYRAIVHHNVVADPALRHLTSDGLPGSLGMQLSSRNLVKITLNDFNWHCCCVSVVLEVIWHLELPFDQFSGVYRAVFDPDWCIFLYFWLLLFEGGRAAGTLRRQRFNDWILAVLDHLRQHRLTWSAARDHVWVLLDLNFALLAFLCLNYLSNYIRV